MAQMDLKPVRSKDEAKKRGQKGGLKSGEARRQKKALRERLELLLQAKGDESGCEAADLICMALIEKARAGDVRAFEVIRDSIGEKPTEKIKTDVQGNLDFRWIE